MKRLNIAWHIARVQEMIMAMMMITMRENKKEKETVMIINLPQYPLAALFAFTLKPQFLDIIYKTHDDLTPAFLPTFPSPHHLSQPSPSLYFS